jgi:predicted transglutaminase-like protease
LKTNIFYKSKKFRKFGASKCQNRKDYVLELFDLFSIVGVVSPLFPGKIKWIFNFIVDGFHFVLRREKKQ